MLNLKSKLILILFAILSTISLISAIVVDDSAVINEIEDCHTEFYDEAEDIFGYAAMEKNVYGSCIYYNSYTYCLNTSGANTDCSAEQLAHNYSCIIGTEPYQSYKKIGEQTIQKNRTVCDKTGYSVDIAGSAKKIDFEKAGYYCSLDGNIITCDSVYDGDGDGKCKSGETCIKFQITSKGISTVQKRIDSAALKDIGIEDA